MKTPWLLMALIPPTPTYRYWRWFADEFATEEKARAKAIKLGDNVMDDVMNLVTGEVSISPWLKRPKELPIRVRLFASETIPAPGWVSLEEFYQMRKDLEKKAGVEGEASTPAS